LSIVKVTRKRQVTLPKEVCDALDIDVGDYVKVYVEGNRAVVEKVLDIEKLAGILNPGYRVRCLAEELDRERRLGERG